MEIAVHHTAFRHGVSRERMLHVVRFCQLPYDDPDEPDLVFFLGDDWNGVPLEVGAVERDTGDLLVIHAMGLRPQFREAYERALEARALP